VVNLDTGWDAIAAFPTTNPPRVNVDEQLGYIIYTSGSTGRPKGVALTHRGAVTLLRWAREVYSAQELSRVLAATSVCFDLSIFEIFLPLSVGGAVVLADNALAIMNLGEAAGVTLVNTVPSAMTELLRLKGLPGSVTTVNLAGEPLPRKLVDQLYATGSVTGVYNLYGPSEDTTYSTFALVPAGETRAPTIGRPIANTQAYILDERLEPVPIGIPGELYLGGAGLARGYHARPELTAEKFVPDIFGGQPGQRLYKTGDLARWMADGQIEFLGRRDHQVKVRGFRIELGEVEASLARHPAVQDCIVLAREDVPGDRRLVGYVVVRPGTPADVKALRDHMRTTLPEYMVPSVLMLMEALPLSPNGKVDRKALPVPETKAGAQTEYVAPRTQVEEELVKIWAEVLAVERVGVNDNFFELGGHSLLATQIVARIRETFKAELPLRGLFETPTVATLSQLIGTDRAPIQRVEAPKIRAIPRSKKSVSDLLSELERLSDEEVQALLARRASKK
jgi:amino acid adenylation domain-containing protein